MSTSEKGQLSEVARDGFTHPHQAIEQNDSVERLFQRCVADLTLAAQQASKPIADSLTSVARRIDDSFFRLQIWGSDMGIESEKKISFPDILQFTEGLLRDNIEMVLRELQHNLNVIGRNTKQITLGIAELRSLGIDQTMQALLSDIRIAADKVSQLIRNLIELSVPIQMEQALRTDTGQYKTLRNHIDHTETLFQNELSQQSEVTPLPLQENTADPWANKQILSLDGGGVKSFSSLLILKELMRVVQELELSGESRHLSSYSPFHPPTKDDQRQDPTKFLYLPCHYFDYIAGTSSGGLLALMLGRLRMTAEECEKDFLKLNNDVLGHSRSWSFHGLFRAKYDSKRLAEAFERVVLQQRRTSSDFSGMLSSSPEMCRTMVVSRIRDRHSAMLAEPYIFRSYDQAPSKDYNPILPNLDPLKVSIVNAARATSAAPMYFSPVKLGESTFLDDGFGAWNNPALLAFREVEKLYDLNKAMLVSIGTGTTTSVSTPRSAFLSKYIWGGFATLSEIPKRTSIDSESTHHNMQALMRVSDKFSYFRFNVQGALGDLRLDEWERKGKKGTPSHEYMRSAVNQYLQQPEVHREMRKVATKLVALRQQRCKAARWQSFCAGFPLPDHWASI